MGIHILQTERRADPLTVNVLIVNGSKGLVFAKYGFEASNPHPSGLLRPSHGLVGRRVFISGQRQAHKRATRLPNERRPTLYGSKDNGFGGTKATAY
jgi:hypothetical protein